MYVTLYIFVNFVYDYHLSVCKRLLFFFIILVDSNDSMYGSDPKFLNELKSMCSTLVEEVLSYLKTLAQSEVCMAL